MKKYIFVHGLAGWGSYDEKYAKKPYWGMRNGDLIQYLRDQGFDCYAASVSPHGSAWDRACELYAQLYGTRVDYGKRHSEEYGHERFGKDFSDCPLCTIEDETELILIGHSFGGTTIRLFSEILVNGSKEEWDASEDDGLSPFFSGGEIGRVRGIVTIASPLNGTTAYDMFEDENFDPDRVKAPWWSNVFAKLMSKRVVPARDGRDLRDYADYDMHVDHAAELNRRMTTFSDVFYFSLPCCSTKEAEDGIQKPILKLTDPFFVKRSSQIGCYSGTTKGGTVIDSTWHKNDGLVNTISAQAPFGETKKMLDQSELRPGVWNVYPNFIGDHMMIHGGLTRKRDVKEIYLDMLTMISDL